jgi:hypothetical protein
MKDVVWDGKKWRQWKSWKAEGVETRSVGLEKPSVMGGSWWIWLGKSAIGNKCYFVAYSNKAKLRKQDCSLPTGKFFLIREINLFNW